MASSSSSKFLALVETKGDGIIMSRKVTEEPKSKEEYNAKMQAHKTEVEATKKAYADHLKAQGQEIWVEGTL